MPARFGLYPSKNQKMIQGNKARIEIKEHLGKVFLCCSYLIFFLCVVVVFIFLSFENKTIYDSYARRKNSTNEKLWCCKCDVNEEETLKHIPSIFIYNRNILKKYYDVQELRVLLDCTE